MFFRFQNPNQNKLEALNDEMISIQDLKESI